MRIDTYHKPASSWWKNLVLFSLISSIILVGYTLLRSTTDTYHIQQYQCDAETIQNDMFITKSTLFNNAKCQSKDHALSGSYSCRCDPTQKYGMSLELPNLQIGDKVITSVWTKGVSGGSMTLVFHSVKNEIYHHTSIARDEKNGWRQLRDTIEIPEGFESDKVKIYAYQPSPTGMSYMDDFRVEVKRKYSRETGITPFETFEIQINDENFKKIANKRDEALQKGLLFSSRADLVDADIRVNDQEWPVRLRLKGDLLDHLHGHNWSYRIELKGNKEWKGMKTFSIHNSKARSHLAEWIMHEIFRREGILTPNYDFIQVQQNGNNQGIYAYEQHFDNQLLLSNERVIGPILRHTDDAYWENIDKNVDPLHWTKASQIELFNKENSKDAKFTKLANQGRNLLDAFLEVKLRVSEVFDVDKMAKYYALLELTHALHAQQFTNIRFYVDPLTGKLEPIGFDCFGDHLPQVKQGWTASGEGINDRVKPKKNYPNGGVYQQHLFRDKEFFARYIHFLKKYTSDEYLGNLEESFQHEIQTREEFIRSDKAYSDYKFSFENIFKKALFSKNKILPLPNYSLKIFTKNGSKQNLSLRSYHYFPMEVIGFGDESILDSLEHPLYLEAYNSKTGVTNYPYDLDQPFSHVFYRTLGTNEIFSSPITKLNVSDLKQNPLTASVETFSDYSFVKTYNDIIQFSSGSHTISSPVLIPQGYVVNIPAGTQLQFIGDGCLYSQSPIVAIGSQREPILFTGEGVVGQAILLSNISGRSTFEHCIFDNLHSFDHLTLQSDGGLSVYKSDMQMTNTIFQKMKGKDVLYLANSEYELADIRMQECDGDGMDAFFSFGKLNNIKMHKMRRDALEIEGGKIEAKSLHFENVASNVIRATEKADIFIDTFDSQNTFRNFDISEASKLYAINVKMAQAREGIRVLTNPEKPTESRLVNISMKDINEEYTVEPGAVLLINGQQKTSK